MRRLRKQFWFMNICLSLIVLNTSIILIVLFNQTLAPSINEEGKYVSQSEVKVEETILSNGDDLSKEQINKEDKSVEESDAADKSEIVKEDIIAVKQEDNVQSKVERIVANMSLKEKIGQLLIVGFQSEQTDQHIKSMITDYHVGGVILYDRNMETPRQVAALTNDLQNITQKTEMKIPLIFSIDQEGGNIVRMRNHVSTIPSQKELGLKGDQDLVYNTAVRTGRELSDMGIHVNFAPVLDLSASDSRSFGLDPEEVGVLGEKVIKGLIESGMTATLKHFPGNGRSNIDPHLEESAVEADRLELENKDIYPFKKIIDELDHQRFFVMVTHIKYPAYDKENPASISPTIIQGLLRKKLGYNGLVITDDLEMGAVNKYFTYEDLGYKAVKAGADLLLVCHTIENQKRVFNGILKAVKTKKLSEERIDEAVRRVLTHKLTFINSEVLDQNE
jgi:beta-N-acetylhexosaminidase